MVNSSNAKKSPDFLRRKANSKKSEVVNETNYEHLDCVIDDDPLAFENGWSDKIGKLEAQDPLEEINLADIYMPGLDRTLVEYRLPLKAGKKLVKQNPRRFAPEVVEKIKAEIQRLLDAKFIQTARYVEWVSNIVPVIKKNGSLRVCIDFRDLNAATPKDEYPMPVADMLFDSASGNEILSLMDGYSGYNQIFIPKEDVPKTAFRCPEAIGNFEWTVMPFGLKNAGATYQRAMNLIFHDFINDFMQVYIDDVVVKSKAKIDHLTHLRMAFERMRSYNLKMNPMKCAFSVSAGKFLGFLIQEKGVEVDSSKSKAIMDCQPPKNKKELQSFLGKVNFLRRFISNLAGRITTFTPLLKLKKEDKFQWNDDHQKAFDEIKWYLVNPPIMTPPTRRKPLKLYISASNETIGSLLAQEDANGHERAIYYLSRTLIDAETRYNAIEKLCLSLYYSCAKLKHYIKPFEVIVTSHFDVIKHFLLKPILHSRIAKWALALTEFSLTYVPLKAMKGQVIADFLANYSTTNDFVEQDFVGTKPWKLYFDGSCHKRGSGIGIMIISPKNIPTKFMYKLSSYCLNNEAEHEALITGLELLIQFKANNIIIRGDSQLVVNQINGNYRREKKNLLRYLEIAKTLITRFDEVRLEHVPRIKNLGANELAQSASGYKIAKEYFDKIIEIRKPIHECNMEILNIDDIATDDWRFEINSYLQDPKSSSDKKLKYKSLFYTL
ncbi:hypothetical protein A2U01_0000455, partial [Trifolium medium]|nr:hypothetical protein [Trifolium medium]